MSDKLCILIVDDQSNMAETLADILNGDFAQITKPL